MTPTDKALVERLRIGTNGPGHAIVIDADTGEDAADRIEALNARVAELEGALTEARRYAKPEPDEDDGDRQRYLARIYALCMNALAVRP